MATQEEAGKSKGFEFRQSFMGRCCNPESAEEKDKKFDFNNCEKMMKQFCGEKNGKFDFETCLSKIEKYCKGMN